MEVSGCGKERMQGHGEVIDIPAFQVTEHTIHHLIDSYLNRYCCTFATKLFKISKSQNIRFHQSFATPAENMTLSILTYKLRFGVN